MTQAADSVAVTPGSGEIIATHGVAGKEHQVFMLADISGHITGSKPSWIYNIASQVHVAAANTVMWDMFNADATAVVRVLSIRQIPNVTTAVTGIVFDWKLARTSAVGTGGTTLTAMKGDLNMAALNANITARIKPTGGATETADILNNYSINSEETTAATIQLASQGGLELVPPLLMPPPIGLGMGILLRQTQGIRVVQITNSNAGNTGWLIGFTVE